VVLTLPPEIKVRNWQDKSSSGLSEDGGCGSHPPSRDQGETLAGQVVFWSFRGRRDVWFSPPFRDQGETLATTDRLLVL
jgi:hypothetical protein